MMKVFVSGQIGDKNAVRDAYKALRGAGMSITHDWTQTDDIGDKLENAEESGRRAALDISGVVDADLYVLMSGNEEVGKGMYVELGAALALREATGRPEVCIVGPMNHMSIFYLHPSIQHFASIQDVTAAQSART
jgi:hypothetical protein